MNRPVSDHFDGKKFHNLEDKGGRKGLLEVIKWKWTTKAAEWPDFVEDNVKAPVLPRVSGTEIRATLVNHASVLVQTAGLNILTDPLYSERTSPYQFVGPKRHRAPGIALDELPPIDIVIVSHNHYDHLDTGSLEELEKRFKPNFFIPLGDTKSLPASARERILEMDWWQNVDLPGGVKLTFVPVQHWSSRWPWDANESLWGGYVIETPAKRTLFAGDTGYAKHFKMIRERIGAMDLSLLPIGAYEPRWFMESHHMNPSDAVQAHKDLESKQSFGIHFGTFQLTDESMEEPVRHLREALALGGVAPEKFLAPKNGQVLEIK